MWTWALGPSGHRAQVGFGRLRFFHNFPNVLVSNLQIAATVGGPNTKSNYPSVTLAGVEY